MHITEIKIQTHKISLQERYFNLIKKGLKTIELRVNDERRKMIKEGDIIHFYLKSDERKILETRVKHIYKAETFEELLLKIDIKETGFDKKEELIDVMSKFYSVEKQKQYGVLGIQIVKIH